MKQFFCGDVVPGCGHTFTGADETIILTHVADHAAAHHDLVEIPPEIIEAVRANITDL